MYTCNVLKNICSLESLSSFKSYSGTLNYKKSGYVITKPSEPGAPDDVILLGVSSTDDVTYDVLVVADKSVKKTTANRYTHFHFFHFFAKFLLGHIVCIHSIDAVSASLQRNVRTRNSAKV